MNSTFLSILSVIGLYIVSILFTSWYGKWMCYFWKDLHYKQMYSNTQTRTSLILQDINDGVRLRHIPFLVFSFPLLLIIVPFIIIKMKTEVKFTSIMTTFKTSANNLKEKFKEIGMTKVGKNIGSDKSEDVITYVAALNTVQLDQIYNLKLLRLRNGFIDEIVHSKSFQYFRQGFTKNPTKNAKEMIEVLFSWTNKEKEIYPEILFCNNVEVNEAFNELLFQNKPEIPLEIQQTNFVYLRDLNRIHGMKVEGF